MKRHRASRQPRRAKKFVGYRRRLSIECLEQRLVLQGDTRNQAPVNVVPNAQTVIQGATLVFQGSNGNQLSTSDPDAGTSNLEVTLSASKGVISLASPGLVQFVKGDGTADATITFRASQSKIRDALAHVSFAAPSNYTGTATLTFTTSDLGNSGKGGEKSDTDKVSINVTAGPPPGNSNAPNQAPFFTKRRRPNGFRRQRFTEG